jgi:hypothetical protein
MVQTKKMNESFFAQLHKDLTVAGEMVRARQDEKQGLLDEFDAECKRFFFGKISERSLASSVKKTNLELKRLDREIRKNIARMRSISNRVMNLASSQAPVVYKATLSGITGGKKKPAKRKKKVARKSVRKKKVARKKRTVRRKKK